MPRRNNRDSGRRRAHDRHQRTDIVKRAGHPGTLTMCPTGKAGFPKAVAEQKLAAYNAASQRHDRVCRIYECPTCAAWHLTSRARL